MIKPPSSYIENNAAFRCLVKSTEKRIFFIEDLSRNHLFLDKFDWNDYIFVQFGWHSHEWRFNYEMEYVRQHKNIDISKICVLANTEIECSEAKKIGFDSIFVNQNCWLDETLFSLSKIPVYDRLYDMVINTRPEGWKRPYLAALVKRLAVIKGFNFRKNDVYDLRLLNPIYINDERISPVEVNQILSNSYCGGIFSEEEGACYSSSEYLLSGLPVVSTFSRGGRDVWYDTNNSMIVEPDEEAVRSAVSILKERLLSGDITSSQIREKHLELTISFRKVFEYRIRTILGNDQRLFLPSEGLGDIFRHKMVSYVKPEFLPMIFSK